MGGGVCFNRHQRAGRNLCTGACRPADVWVLSATVTSCRPDPCPCMDCVLPRMSRGDGMRRMMGVGRRAAVVVVAVGCVLSGVVLVWRLATPELIPSLGTWSLVGIIGLFVFPAVTLGAWELDRRAARARAFQSLIEDQEGFDQPEAFELKLVRPTEPAPRVGLARDASAEPAGRPHVFQTTRSNDHARHHRRIRHVGRGVRGR